jgi:hypothetical protein
LPATCITRFQVIFLPKACISCQRRFQSKACYYSVYNIQMKITSNIICLLRIGVQNDDNSFFLRGHPLHPGKVD